MFMLTADSAIGFCWTEVVNTISLQSVFLEIAQYADDARLLTFAMAKSRCSKLSDLVD